MMDYLYLVIVFLSLLGVAACCITVFLLICTYDLMEEVQKTIPARLSGGLNDAQL